MRAHLRACSAAALLGACGPKTDLDPLAGARRVVGVDEGVMTDAGDLRVVLQTSRWPGPTPIQQRLTPVHVALDNTGDSPIAIRYRDFALETPYGQRLTAVAPVRVRGTVQEAVTVAPIPDPTFGWSGFQVAPYYGARYPTLTTWGGTLGWDPWFDRGSASAWVEVPLPSADMLAAALPEGVLAPGGHLDGWLYFPPIPRDVDAVTLSADLYDPTTGVVDARLRVPYDAG